MITRTRSRLAAALFAGLVSLPNIAATRVHPPRHSIVQLSTGIQMHYAEQGRRDGEAVILLHGYTDSWFSFSRILPYLPDEYHVFALDMRGHGQTDRPASGYGMTDLAADVIAFMDAKGIVRATIVGHSMGGFIAQQVALAAPRRVARLVIVSSARTPRAFNGFADFKQVVDSLTDPVSIEFVEEFQRSTIHTPVPDAFLAGVISESERLPARVWREIMNGMLDVEPAVSLGRSGIPALVIWGEQDAWPPRAEQDSLVAMLRSAQLEIMRDVGHAPHWERPDEFARGLRAFIERTRPSAE